MFTKVRVVRTRQFFGSKPDLFGPVFPPLKTDRILYWDPRIRYFPIELDRSFRYFDFQITPVDLHQGIYLLIYIFLSNRVKLN